MSDSYPRIQYADIRHSNAKQLFDNWYI